MASRRSNLAVRSDLSPESGPVSAELLDLSLVEGVDPERWLDLLQDQTEPLPPADSEQFYSAVHRLLHSSSVSHELQEVLQYLSDLGNDAGQEAIQEAMEGEQAELPAEAHGDTPPSLVVRLWCLGARTPLWLMILKLAWLGVTARMRLERPLREYSGSGASPRALTPALERSVADLLGPVLHARGVATSSPQHEPTDGLEGLDQLVERRNHVVEGAPCKVRQVRQFRASDEAQEQVDQAQQLAQRREALAYVGRVRSVSMANVINRTTRRGSATCGSMFRSVNQVLSRRPRRVILVPPREPRRERRRSRAL